jgi:transcriptional regulator with XRE-family HTH domain
MDYRQLEQLALPGDISKEAVGLRMAAGLKVANLKQAELARAINRTQGAIGNAVAGSNYPSIDALQELYRLTRVDFNFFLVGQTAQLPADVQARLLYALEAVHREREQRPG